MSTFNVCAEDNMNMVAFILPGNEGEEEFESDEEALGVDSKGS